MCIQPGKHLYKNSIGEGTHNFVTENTTSTGTQQLWYNNEGIRKKEGRNAVASSYVIM